MRPALIRFAVLTLGFAALPMACGARTPLGAPEAVDVTIGVEASIDVRIDVRADARVDVDARPDALPGLDATRRDVVVPDDCPDGGGTLVYLLSQEGQLLSFYPPTRAFRTIGDLACPGAETPHSMAVDRTGVAYALLGNLDDNDPHGNVYRLSTRTAACTGTPYDETQTGFSWFGMGFVARNGIDQLFISDNTGQDKGLAVLDTTTFGVAPVGPFDLPIGSCEFTGTGDGRLFAYCINRTQSGSTINEIEPETARVIASDSLSIGTPQDGFAVAFWGGHFWIFNANGGTVVTDYDPAAKTETEAARFEGTIVGAGVSTCAPL